MSEKDLTSESRLNSREGLISIVAESQERIDRFKREDIHGIMRTWAAEDLAHAQALLWEWDEKHKEKL